MDSALIIVGLAMVLAFQVAIHLRIAGIPTRVAMLRAVTEARPQKDDAFQEALARRLNLILQGIKGYHDQIADDFRIQVAAGEQRARLAEGRRGDDAGVTAELRALAREMTGIAAELRALQGDLAELMLGAAERRASPSEAPPAAPAAPPTPEHPDERKTIEMTPPASCAPPAAPAPAAANDREMPNDEGWDDPDEKTKLFSKDTAASVVQVAIRQPGGAKGARAARHALRPPPPPLADGDDAMERPSILPEARRS